MVLQVHCFDGEFVSRLKKHGGTYKMDNRQSCVVKTLTPLSPFRRVLLVSGSLLDQWGGFGRRHTASQVVAFDSVVSWIRQG